MPTIKNIKLGKLSEASQLDLTSRNQLLLLRFIVNC